MGMAVTATSKGAEKVQKGRRNQTESTRGQRSMRLDTNDRAIFQLFLQCARKNKG
jgi:hypothetical protein